MNGENAAEIYRVKQEYRRFNQKDNIIWQPEWNEKLTGFGDGERLKSAIRRTVNDEPGFTMFDWAFLGASEANYKATDFKVNVANQGGNSWSTIGIGKPEELSPWQGDINKMTEAVKKMAYFFGADLVGIARLDRRWVYSHYFEPDSLKSFPICFSDENGYEAYDRPVVLDSKTAVIPAKMKYVIVMLHEMDYDGIRTAPDLAEMALVHYMYSKISFTATSIAEFLRSLGYNAIPSANGTALNIPLAIDAGLGQLGRNAKLINPLYGPRCRISKVITDLPLTVEQPVSLGVAEYCSTCKICAETCPVQAIPYGPPRYKPEGEFNQKHVLQWQMKHDICRKYWARIGTNCGLCIASCPYSREKGLKKWFLTSELLNISLLNRLRQKYAVTPLLEPGEFWEM